MDVTIERIRKTGAVAGILFVVLAIVALVLPGSAPKADEGPAEIASYFADERGAILASDYLLGLAIFAFLIFAGCLRVHFGNTDRSGLRPGSVALAGAAVGSALLLAGAALANAGAFRSEDVADPAVKTALYDSANALFFMSGFGFAAFFAGCTMAGRTSGSLPESLVATAGVVAALQVISAVGLFAESGFFATGGAFGYIAPLAALLWVLGASIVLLRGGWAERST